MASTFTGKVWKFGDDINTDLVIPNFAVLMTVEEQSQHCFSANRPGLGRRGAAGRRPRRRAATSASGSARNIGAVFHALGISGVVAESFNGLGLAQLHQRRAAVAALRRASSTSFDEGDIAEVDWTTGAVRNVTPGRDRCRAARSRRHCRTSCTRAESRTSCAARATSRPR